MQLQPIDKKRVQSFRTRIKRAQSTLACMGDMILQMDIDAMHPLERAQLRAALLAGRSPVSYQYLDQKVEADFGGVK